MDQKIWKYELDIGDRHEIQMPLNAVPIYVQVQGGTPCMWAEVDPSAATQTRKFRIVGTGHQLPPQPRKYIGTIQSPPFVWHIYEELSK